MSVVETILNFAQCDPFEVGCNMPFSDGLRPSVTMHCDDSVVNYPPENPLIMSFTILLQLVSC